MDIEGESGTLPRETMIRTIRRLIEERDQARAIAVQLEQEIHACREGHFFHQGYHDRG